MTAIAKLNAIDNVNIDESADIYEQEQNKILPLGIETECKGGGRIEHDPVNGILFVYGHSTAFGRADHNVTVKLLKEKYPEYKKIHFSNEGY